MVVVGLNGSKMTDYRVLMNNYMADYMAINVEVDI